MSLIANRIMDQPVRNHDPECACNRTFLCATEPESRCRKCGHSRAQHFARAADASRSCMFGSCGCDGYAGPGVRGGRE